jgi:predicted DNA binding CopG/RHH family protein
MPKFENEEAQASWWCAHRVEVEADHRRLGRLGKTIKLSDILAQARKKAELKPVTSRLVSKDVETARELADEKGIGYQTYISILLHESIRKESAQRSLRKLSGKK